MPNHLASASSPYLLQHADNPVDWYPWDTEALDKARQENKPIFLSIGYAACHWCHVMAHESFEDPDIAVLMNTYYVNIKVDREERPDLDSIFMSFVVALTGQGGWPMSVFLTPEGKPFYGGTYYPPRRSHNLPSFREILETIARLWKEDQSRLVTSAEELSEKLRASTLNQRSTGEVNLTSLQQVTHTLAGGYDWHNGGWGGAPKFPQPMLIEFLLRQGSRGDQESIDMATHALTRMAQGGMYDILGGGFSRYSVDPTWLIPHFEKMLYDNAQLARVYLHAFQLTGNPFFREVCESTLDFVLRELSHPDGGFFSSLDADSEGEEGKFYLWTEDEIRSVIPDTHEADLFMHAYGASQVGNFEGKNILRRIDDEQLANELQLVPSDMRMRFASVREQLLEIRSSRVRPNTDDKVLVSWNALMLTALSEAGRALAREDYLQAASRNADFILGQMVQNGRLMRSWREGAANHYAYLEDHAGLVLALIALYQADPNVSWFQAARSLIEQIQEHFADPAGGFFDTRDDHETLLYRPKDLQDNATPSGNALAVTALLGLAAFEDRSDWLVIAEEMLSANLEMIKRYPTAFGQWLCAADFSVGPVQEVAIIGIMTDPDTQKLLYPLRSDYRPRLILAASAYPPPDDGPALLNDRPLLKNKPTAYVCQNFLCKQPVNTPEEMLEQLDNR